jgi:hypothetical protein
MQVRYSLTTSEYIRCFNLIAKESTVEITVLAIDSLCSLCLCG